MNNLEVVKIDQISPECKMVIFTNGNRLSKRLIWSDHPIYDKLSVGFVVKGEIVTYDGGEFVRTEETGKNE